MSATTSNAPAAGLPRFAGRGEIPAGLLTVGQLRKQYPQRVPRRDAKLRGVWRYQGRDLDLYALADTIPRYTHWEEIPGDLFTRAALARMDPPRKPAPGARPWAEALYHGNETALLYELGATVAKRRASPAQRAAAERARRLQHVCRRCGAGTYAGAPDARPPYGTRAWGDRLCALCKSVILSHGHHLSGQRWARRLFAEDLAERVGVMVMAEEPGGDRAPKVVLVGFPDAGWDGERAVAGPAEIVVDLRPADAPAGARALQLVGDALGGLGRPPLLLGWEGAPARPLQWFGGVRQGDYGPKLWDALRPYPWLHGTAAHPSRELASTWTPWHCEPRSKNRTADPHVPCESCYRHQDRAPGTGNGDLVADAITVMGLLADVANGTAAVAKDAPWRAYPPVIAGYEGV